MPCPKQFLVNKNAISIHSRPTDLCVCVCVSPLYGNCCWSSFLEDSSLETMVSWLVGGEMLRSFFSENSVHAMPFVLRKHGFHWGFIGWHLAPKISPPEAARANRRMWISRIPSWKQWSFHCKWMILAFNSHREPSNWMAKNPSLGLEAIILSW